MKTLKPRTHERGFVLLVVYIVVIIVSIFSVAFFSRHRGAIQATERYQNRILAFNAAESGIDFALRELAINGARLSGTETTAYTSGVTTLPQSAFSYVISPVAGQSTVRRIDSKGCAPSCTSTSRAYQDSDITVYARIATPPPPGSLFEYGLYTKGSLILSGNGFDSYHSGQGAYGGSNISSAGEIATEVTHIGTIELDHTTVNGSVLVGEGGNPDTVITLKKATITGTQGTLSADDTLKTPTPIESLPEPPTEIDLSNVSSGTITLAPGTYHTSAVNISGNGKIVATGTVKIYVDSGINITGNGITVPNNQPGNLHLYATGSGAVKIAGNGAFYGGIFAPNSDVVASGNGDIFGAIVAKTFETTGNSAVHFDLAMKEIQAVDPNQTNIVRITAWQELNSLAWGSGT